MSDTAQTEKRKFRIVGTVQGVGYRAWLQAEAKARGVGGWGRNEMDGSVTALLCGPGAALDELAGLLRIGPEASDVLDAIPLHVDEGDDIPAAEEFEIRAGGRG